MQPLIEGKPALGATYLGDGRARFLVWAPRRQRVDVRLVDGEERLVAMEAHPTGYFEAVVDHVAPGARYYYRLDGDVDRPDPASRSQPDGVHGPSAIVERRTQPDSQWRGLPLRDYILYELHVGTFSESGTFDGAIEHLDALVDLGVTAVEVMPIAEFPGHRNWGYDGVYPFAVETSYGGPDGFGRLVEACHQRGLAVVLDVVYNHLGPEGNYLHDYGPYFTDKYRTPWGQAINFDGADSDEVRRYFLQNAAQWIDEYGVDALRLDAVHAIFDDTPVTFLEELRALVDERRRRLRRPIHLIAETHANDPRLVRLPEQGGLGMHAHWSDDFHHAIHTLLTDERQDYYCDYGGLGPLTRCLRDGYSYTGQRSEYRGRRHGKDPAQIPGERFVVCVQNHDQVGNRPQGRRLGDLVNFEQQKLAASALLLSPYVPLLFMGEAYGEEAPFPYFIDHGDPDLVEAVRRGRRAEFTSLADGADIPDPASPQTFASARLDHDLRAQGRHRLLWRLHKQLIEFRRDHPALAHLLRDQMEVIEAGGGQPALAIRRWYAGRQALILLNFGADCAAFDLALTPADGPPANWIKRLETTSPRWGGPGARLAEFYDCDPGERLRLELGAHGAALFDALPAVED